MKRHGTVLVFKKGTTPEEAAKALGTIRDVLDEPDTMMVLCPHGQYKGKYVEIPFNFVGVVNEFDDEYGGPVWYIP